MEKSCTWIYFILSPREKLVKIGFTSDHPDKRLRDLRMMNASPLEALAVIPKGKRFEKALHDRFSVYRDHGEWFRYVQTIQDYIQAKGKPWPDNFANRRVIPKFPPLKLYRMHRRGATFGELAFQASIPISRVKVLVKAGRRQWEEKRWGYSQRKQARRSDPEEEHDCPECAGQGTTPFDGQCPACGGTGLAADS